MFALPTVYQHADCLHPRDREALLNFILGCAARGVDPDFLENLDVAVATEIGLRDADRPRARLSDDFWRHWTQMALDRVEAKPSGLMGRFFGQRKEDAPAPRPGEFTQLAPGDMPTAAAVGAPETGPQVGDTVLYKLSGMDAANINQRYGDAEARRVQILDNKLGYQAHVGNRVSAGEVVPMVVVKPWGADCVNGKVLLDGNDDLWVTSAPRGEGEGQWLPKGR